MIVESLLQNSNIRWSYDLTLQPIPWWVAVDCRLRQVLLTVVSWGGRDNVIDSCLLVVVGGKLDHLWKSALYSLDGQSHYKCIFTNFEEIFFHSWNDQFQLYISLSWSNEYSDASSAQRCSRAASFWSRIWAGGIVMTSPRRTWMPWLCSPLWGGGVIIKVCIGGGGIQNMIYDMRC